MRDDHADHLEGTTTMHDEKTTVYRVADEKAVRGLYSELMDGWNRGSGEDFAAVFAEDGDLVAFDGTHFEGRGDRPVPSGTLRQVAEGHAARGKGQGRQVPEPRRRPHARGREHHHAR